MDLHIPSKNVMAQGQQYISENFDKHLQLNCYATSSFPQFKIFILVMSIHDWQHLSQTLQFKYTQTSRRCLPLLQIHSHLCPLTIATSKWTRTYFQDSGFRNLLVVFRKSPCLEIVFRTISVPTLNLEKVPTLVVLILFEDLLS